MQGEMFPYWDPYYYPKDIVTSNFYFGDAPPLNWSHITRWNYIEEGIAEPPQLTLYTYFTIEQYLGFFLCIFAVQFVLHLALKLQTNPLVFQKLSWIDCVIHIISCCFIPCPMEEWDTEKGTVAMHRARKHLVFKEMMAAMILNFIFNIFMLIPLVILGKHQVHMKILIHYSFTTFSDSLSGTNIFDRHDILVNSIGAFPEEIAAYEQIKLMIGFSYPILVLLTAIQIVSYNLYNGRYHPFAIIVMPKTGT